ncbi:uncharacterized protein LOC112906400 [Agrilus planipennis]|uniref:Uncharacterized protein LOC112906400 n=1 Tax=Agrilus planipennis TaxID=224129 RepID=A0A7F5RJS5_AGRPL|nr:uncharacterized protein LOC112906400 [Agrilus planipennis]
MSKRLYNPANQRDAEELLAVLNDLDSDDEYYEDFDNADQLDFVLLPPVDGEDSDQDDGPSDDELPPLITDLGRGLLAQFQLGPPGYGVAAECINMAHLVARAVFDFEVII